MLKTIRSVVVGAALVLSIAGCAATPPEVATVAAQPAADVNITLVLTSDVYKMSAEGGRGGLARIAAALKAEKETKAHVLTVHAGDTLSPSLMSGFDKGAHIVELFNMSPLDILVPGNHEFDFGPEVFRKRMGEFKARILAANLSESDGTPLPGIASSELLSFGRVKVGVIGLTDENSVSSSKPGKLRFGDSLAVGAREAEKLRKQGADLIVVVAHAGRDRDEALFSAGFADVILSGHDHDLYMRFNEKAAIVEAGEDGMAVVAVDLKVSVGQDRNGRRQVRWWPKFRFVDTADVTPDPAVASRVETFEAQLSRDLDVPAGTTQTELDSRNAAVRGGEAAIGNLFTDAIREATKADIALLNGGGFRGGRIYPAGSTLTRKDVLGELPFLNKAYVLEISGADLRRAVEEGFAGAENEVGRFPQVSGLKIRADVTRPAGKRVVSLLANGVPVQPRKTYRLATNDYLAKGGDGYRSLAKARVIVGEEDASLVTSIVIAHLEARKTVSPRLEGRIVVARARAPQ
jgi:2',3'-cyclic-nucleotide 2'-phosphodiesterase (5'-nucleotidase family)